MKISFPKSKIKPRFCRRSKIYLVICKFRNGEWGVASFWSLDYSHANYLNVIEMKKDIVARATKVACWKEKDFLIMKLEV